MFMNYWPTRPETLSQRAHGLITESRHDDVITWKHFRVTGHLCRHSVVTAELPAQRPVTRSFDVFFDLRLNIRLSKQSWGWWFETLLRPWWRHCNDEDSPCLDLYHDSNAPSRQQISICHDSWILVTCAKLWSDLNIIFRIRITDMFPRLWFMSL